MPRHSIPIVLALCLVSAATACGQAGSTTQAPSIEPAALHALQASGGAPVVIDVRTPGEYAAGRIPGAVNVPWEQITERIGEIDAPHGVALYCGVGPRARKAEAALLASGHRDVLHIEGGFTAWRAAELPVEHAP